MMCVVRWSIYLCVCVDVKRGGRSTQAHLCIMCMYACVCICVYVCVFVYMCVGACICYGNLHTNIHIDA